MGEDRFSIDSISLVNIESGETILPLNVDDFIAHEHIENESATFNWNIPTTISFSTDGVISESYQDFLNSRLNDCSCEFDGQIIIGIAQARKHKQKRINKKWLKKYGMKPVYKQVHAKLLEIKAADYGKGVCEITGKLDDFDFI